MERDFDFSICPQGNNSKKHDWQVNNSTVLGGNHYPSTAICTRCKRDVELSVLMQLDSVKHLKGFQSKVSILSLAISLIAIVISVFQFYSSNSLNFNSQVKYKVFEDCFNYYASKIPTGASISQSQVSDCKNIADIKSK